MKPERIKRVCRGCGIDFIIPRYQHDTVQYCARCSDIETRKELVEEWKDERRALKNRR